MSNYYEILVGTLKQDTRYLAEDGALLKVRVREAADRLDADLLRMLMSQETLREIFFTDVDGVLVFDKAKFNWVIESREFLPDSYTAFKNKIGLADRHGSLLSQSNDVSLVWPYKDCVLEGGQTREDKGQDEIFYNETLAPDEVRRLLYPKALKNAKRYTQDGVETITEFNPDDNLIIKGNNLLALSSLLERYEGQVKCIYIDPPYNTQNDGFRYNDSFNHSTWLTFMKNRLELAKRLLRDDGVIFVQCDDNEQAYLKVLMDGMFERDNVVNTIITVTNLKGNQDQLGVAGTHEYLLCYAKQLKNINLFHLPIDEEEFLAEWSEDDYGFYKQGATLISTGKNSPREHRPALWYPILLKNEQLYLPETDVLQKIYSRETKEFNDSFLSEYIAKKEKEGYTAILPFVGKQKARWRWSYSKLHRQLDDILIVDTKNGKSLYKKQRPMLGDLPTKKPKSTFYKPEYSSGNGTVEIKKLFGNKVFLYPKSEHLIQDILYIGSEPSDLVLDFHLGSGTTAAVAHKMGRRYIGVEQMDYIEDVAVERLKKVIDGEQGGISKAQNWQGGGSFVYVELAEQNETLMTALQAAQNSDEVLAVLDDATQKGQLKPAVLPDDLSLHREELATLSLEEQKHIVADLIDKNRLYVNACDVDDQENGLSDSDRAFTKSFYRSQEDQ